MPELPEVEVLVRHLRPLILNQTIKRVTVRRGKVIWPTSERKLQRELVGARFTSLERRGKYLLFEVRQPERRTQIALVGHLGMSGRMFLTTPNEDLPKHAAVVLDLGRRRLVYEDARYFGRLTLDVGAIQRLGPEPTSKAFTADYLSRGLARSTRPIKAKLLDQTLVAGIGNIYASEALFVARLSPRRKANRIKRAEMSRLIRAIRKVLDEAIRFGSTVPLHHGPSGKTDGLFYFGRAENTSDYYEERLRVYDRAGEPCRRCHTPIRRITQAARSTYFCPECQA